MPNPSTYPSAQGQQDLYSRMNQGNPYAQKPPGQQGQNPNQQNQGSFGDPNNQQQKQQPNLQQGFLTNRSSGSDAQSQQQPQQAPNPWAGQRQGQAPDAFQQPQTQPPQQAQTTTQQVPQPPPAQQGPIYSFSDAQGRQIQGPQATLDYYKQQNPSLQYTQTNPDAYNQAYSPAAMAADAAARQGANPLGNGAPGINGMNPADRQRFEQQQQRLNDSKLQGPPPTPAYWQGPTSALGQVNDTAYTHGDPNTPWTMNIPGGNSFQVENPMVRAQREAQNAPPTPGSQAWIQKNLDPNGPPPTYSNFSGTGARNNGDTSTRPANNLMGPGTPWPDYGGQSPVGTAPPPNNPLQPGFLTGGTPQPNGPGMNASALRTQATTPPTDAIGAPTDAGGFKPDFTPVGAVPGSPQAFAAPAIAPPPITGAYPGLAQNFNPNFKPGFLTNPAQQQPGNVSSAVAGFDPNNNLVSSTNPTFQLQRDQLNRQTQRGIGDALAQVRNSLAGRNLGGGAEAQLSQQAMQNVLADANTKAVQIDIAAAQEQAQRQNIVQGQGEAARQQALQAGYGLGNVAAQGDVASQMEAQRGGIQSNLMQQGYGNTIGQLTAQGNVQAGLAAQQGGIQSKLMQQGYGNTIGQMNAQGGIEMQKLGAQGNIQAGLAAQQGGIQKGLVQEQGTQARQDIGAQGQMWQGIGAARQTYESLNQMGSYYGSQSGNPIKNLESSPDYANLNPEQQTYAKAGALAAAYKNNTLNFQESLQRSNTNWQTVVQSVAEMGKGNAGSDTNRDMANGLLKVDPTGTLYNAYLGGQSGGNYAMNMVHTNKGGTGLEAFLNNAIGVAGNVFGGALGTKLGSIFGNNSGGGT